MIFTYTNGKFFFALYLVLHVAVMGLAVWCHQLWGRCLIGRVKVHWIYPEMQRVALILLALSMCWSLSTTFSGNWFDGRPYLLTLAAINLYLFATAMGVTWRTRRVARRTQLP